MFSHARGLVEIGSRWVVWATEAIIEGVIWLCGWSTIFLVFAIFFFIFREGGPYLIHDLDLREFFTSTRWEPTANEPKFGIVALLAGTLSVTALAMAMAVPLGLGGCGVCLRIRPQTNQGVAQDHHRDSGGDPFDRVGIHRSSGA